MLSNKMYHHLRTKDQTETLGVYNLMFKEAFKQIPLLNCTGSC